MEKRPTLREFFEMAKKAGHDSLGISKDVECLKILKHLAEKRGNYETAKLIDEDIQELLKEQ